MKRFSELLLEFDAANARRIYKVRIFLLLLYGTTIIPVNKRGAFVIVLQNKLMDN